MLLIHVVAPGDTLFTIAARYGVSVGDLVATNKPPNPDSLVVGQALIVPTADLTYAVRRGDTLFAIAQVFGIAVTSLAAANDIVNPDLIYPGQVLLVPGWEALIYTVRPGDTMFRLAQSFGAPLSLLIGVNNIANPDVITVGQQITVPLRGVERRPLATNGFIFPTSLTNGRLVLTPISRLLTYISVFDFPVDGLGGITIPNYAPVVQAARELTIAPLAVLTNFRGGNFDPDLARAVLSNTAIGTGTIDRYLAVIREGGFAGAMVDFENMYPQDRNLYTQFIAELGRRLRPLGLVNAIAVAPKWADYPNAPWVGAFDYAALGQQIGRAHV